MPKPTSPLEIRLYTVLKRIASYQSVAQIRRSAERDWGLDPEEALEMTYENVLGEAKFALRGLRRPDPAPSPMETRS